jgi:hypothetical protein
MRVPDDDTIERLLRESGAKWRQRVPQTVQLNTIRFQDQDSRWPRMGRWSAAVASLAAILAVIYVSLPGSRQPSGAEAPTESSPTRQSPAATQLPSLSRPPDVPASEHPTHNPTRQPSASGHADGIRWGDSVTVTGQLALRPTRICWTIISLDGTTGTCAEPAVRVDGFSAGQIEAVGGAGRVTVLGTWTGNSVAATSISRAPAEPIHVPDAPCDEPTGDWPSEDRAAEVEAAEVLLGEHLAADPERYASMWTAKRPGGTDRWLDRVLVVGTISNPNDVESELRGVYPYRLCVVKVDYSEAELVRVSSELSAMYPSWFIGFEPRLNRVTVRVTVLDVSTAANLRPYARFVSVDPLVQRH